MFGQNHRSGHHGERQELETVLTYALETGSAQWIGTRNRLNDAVGILHTRPEMGLCMVTADGIGTDEAAGRAAREALKAVTENYEGETLIASLPAQTLGFLGKAHARLEALNRHLLSSGEMTTGAAVACLLLRGGKACVASVGNVRTFLLRRSLLLPLSRDQLLSLETEERDILSGDAPEVESDMAMMVTAYAGMENLKRLDWTVLPVSLCHDDRLIQMSSGLYGVLKEETLTGLLEQGTAQEAADLVMDRVRGLRARSQSNASLCIVHVL